LSHCSPIGTVLPMHGEPPNAYAAPDLSLAILPGEMREAAVALLEYEVELGGLYRMCWACLIPGNKAPRGVFWSLGFRDRGVRQLRVCGGVERAGLVRD
ncbi:hypothetical protein C8A03DRAFT_16443, partial [Achaetomium macrosporum]